jgi:hypothetical protein
LKIPASRKALSAANAVAVFDLSVM